MNAQHSTENLTIHHKVKDYATWRKGYDEHEKSRNSAGITNGKVFRSAEDPNDVLILQDVADVAKAREELEARNRRIAEAKAAQEARAAALMASREQPVEEAPDAPEEIMDAAAEEIAGPEGDREPD